MRKLYSIIFLFGALIIQAQDLEHIIQKHHEAHNQNIWNMIRTFSADMEWHSDVGTFYGDAWAKKPNQICLKSEKAKFIEAYDGNSGWTQAYWTNGEVTDMSPIRTMMVKDLISFGSPIESIDGLTLMGKVEVDNIPCYWLETMDGNLKVEYFIDRKEHRLYKTILTRPGEAGNTVVSRTVKQYRVFNGIPVATVIDVKSNELTSEYVFDGIVLGEGIPSSRFKKPTDGQP